MNQAGHRPEALASALSDAILPALRHWKRVTLLGEWAVNTLLLLLALAALKWLALGAERNERLLSPLNGIVTLLEQLGTWALSVGTEHLGVVRLAAVASVLAPLAYEAVRQRRIGFPNWSAPVLTGSALMLSATFIISNAFLWAAIFGLAAAASMLYYPSALMVDPSPLARRRLWILGVFSVAVVLRFYALADHPSGFGGHAAGTHLTAIRLYEELHPAIASGDWDWVRDFIPFVLFEHMAPNSFMESYGSYIWGFGITQYRFAAATLGCVAVLLAYAFGRNLLDERFGLLFAFLLAAAPWHVTISRYEDTEHAMVAFQLLLSLYFVLKATRGGRLIYWILAGLALGLCWYIYAANQIVPLIVLGYVAYWSVANRSAWRSTLPKLGLFLVVFALVSYPEVQPQIARGKLPLRAPYQSTDSEYHFRQVGELVDGARGALSQLFVQSSDPWFSKPGGALGITEATLLLPGIVLCVFGLLRARWRDVSVLLLLWFVVAPLPGVLSGDPTFRRLFLIGVEALCLAALVLWLWLRQAHSVGVPRWVLAVAVAACGLLYVALNTEIYFERAWADDSDRNAYQANLIRAMESSWSREFMYIYTFSDDQRGILTSFVRAGTYPRLQKGVDPNGYFRIVVGDELNPVLTDPKSINGAFRVLAEPSLAERDVEGFSLAAAMQSSCPACKQQTLRDSRGRPAVVSWTSVEGAGR
jgi:hypothetical protein